MRALVLVVLAAGAAQESPRPDEDRVKKALRAEKALKWLDDSDAEVRQMGRAQLREMGRDALPFIEKRLGERGADELLKALRDIEQGSGNDGWVDSKELPPGENSEKEIPKIDARVADRYVRIKYDEARTHALRGNFQKGFDMANALVILEPKSSVTDTIRKLRRYCENMITQTTLLEARVVQSKPAYVMGEPIELTLRLKNLYKSAMTIQYDKATPDRAGQGMAVIEVRFRAPDFDKSELTLNRFDELKFESEIPIATGAQWEKRFVLNAFAGVESPEQMHVYIVDAWTHPLRIETDGRPVTRRIQFEPAVVKVIPKKYEGFIENPLESLAKTMEAGIVHEVFLCCMLLEGKQKEGGVDLLVRTMQKTETRLGRQVIARLLGILTDQKLGSDPKKWEEWHKTVRGGKENPK